MNKCLFCGKTCKNKYCSASCKQKEKHKINSNRVFPKKHCIYCGKLLVRKKITDNNSKRGWKWETLRVYKDRNFCNKGCAKSYNNIKKYSDPEERKKLSKLLSGRTFSENHKKKISEATLRRRDKYGYINSPQTRSKISKALSNGSLEGENNPRWKGGRRKHSLGYIEVYNPSHPWVHSHTPYVLEHRVVMEEVIGRYLNPEEEVHHINGVRDDNRPENLMLFANKSEHMKYEGTDECRSKKKVTLPKS